MNAMANKIAILAAVAGLMSPWRDSIPARLLLSSSQPDDRVGLANATAAKLEEQAAQTRDVIFSMFSPRVESKRNAGRLSVGVNPRIFGLAFVGFPPTNANA